MDDEGQLPVIQPEAQRSYGLLLPHFGEHASRQSIADGALLAERLGFDAAWVRDHVVYRPHHYEDHDPLFLDPLVVLGVIAGATTHIGLATGCLIPYRHPIQSARSLSSLDFLAGGGRVVVGLGLGSSDHEFEAVGMGGWDRRALTREQVEIWHRLWSGEEVDWRGRFYSFDGVRISPRPKYGRLPVWYAGASLAAVRRAVEYCDGWIPGRIPRWAYRERIARMVRLAQERAASLPVAAVIPFVSPGRTLEEAVRGLDLDGILREVRSRYGRSGEEGASALNDLDGAVIAGPPERIVEEVSKFHDEGATHVVFDLRMRFADWEECIHLIGNEVLSVLRADGPVGPLEPEFPAHLRSVRSPPSKALPMSPGPPDLRRAGEAR